MLNLNEIMLHNKYRMLHLHNSYTCSIYYIYMCVCGCFLYVKVAGHMNNLLLRNITVDIQIFTVEGVKFCSRQVALLKQQFCSLRRKALAAFYLWRICRVHLFLVLPSLQIKICNTYFYGYKRHGELSSGNVIINLQFCKW